MKRPASLIAACAGLAFSCVWCNAEEFPKPYAPPCTERENVFEFAEKPSSKGVFTCSYGGMLRRLFPAVPGREKEMSQRVKDERYFVRRFNRNMLVFVKNVQDRSDQYVDFGVGLMTYLDEQEKKHPEQGEFIGKLKVEWGRPVSQYGKPLPNTQKLDNVRRATDFAKDFLKATKVDTPEQTTLGFRRAGQIPDVIGDPGDRRLRNLRRKVMVIRAMATMEMARNPATGEIAKEIRRRTEAALRNPHSHEKVTVW